MVQKIPKLRGRPRNFDESEALAGATHVFWAKGYDGATIDDLTAGMGVGRPSLYSIFGDKPTLFRRCLELYASGKGVLAVQALTRPASVRDAVRGFLRFSVESATVRGSPLGCLMICAAPLVDDAKVQEFLRRASAQATEVIEQRLRAGVQAGQLPANFPAAVRARQVLDLSRGLTVRARIGSSRKELLADADDGAELILRSAF